MKTIKYLIIFLFSLFFADFYGMEVDPPVSHAVQAYFLPRERMKIMSKLFSLLDKANKQVLVAMYWITEDLIVDKFILLKKRGIDVRIIFDENSDNSTKLMNKLLNNDIVPIIFPSVAKEAKGIMHDKFLVVDDTAVFTGSANFTKTAFNPASEYSNYENVVILYPKNIVQKFHADFLNIERDISELYIRIIASNYRNQLPQWINHLLPVLYKHKPFSRLKQSYLSLFREFYPIEQSRLQKFFRQSYFSLFREFHPTK